MARKIIFRLNAMLLFLRIGVYAGHLAVANAERDIPLLSIENSSVIVARCGREQQLEVRLYPSPSSTGTNIIVLLNQRDKWIGAASVSILGASIHALTYTPPDLIRSADRIMIDSLLAEGWNWQIPHIRGRSDDLNNGLTGTLNKAYYSCGTSISATFFTGSDCSKYPFTVFIDVVPDDEVMSFGATDTQADYVLDDAAITGDVLHLETGVVVERAKRKEDGQWSIIDIRRGVERGGVGVSP